MHTIKKSLIKLCNKLQIFTFCSVIFVPKFHITTYLRVEYSEKHTRREEIVDSIAMNNPRE
ncbi:hypothetical protein BpHYR1_050013 [Brachionus plicatilis]|uniref:Uncharacterized protein n=1 Tax=Brachionus plicatilis TaxID=10195 RepID=A0A3M7QPZ4_BRAPC|nr:hypothetical protein BpHYR1_050013 [Brachionus plicatilis]